MNRRSNERIEMRLPCMLSFPGHWRLQIPGFTANMHRDGVLVACDFDLVSEEVPEVGSKGRLKIELPPNPSFSRKCIECDTVLVRVSDNLEGEQQFAMRIRTVAFRDWKVEGLNLKEMETHSTRLPV